MNGKGFWDFAAENPGTTLMIALGLIWSAENCVKYICGYKSPSIFD